MKFFSSLLCTYSLIAIAGITVGCNREKTQEPPTPYVETPMLAKSLPSSHTKADVRNNASPPHQRAQYDEDLQNLVFNSKKTSHLDNVRELFRFLGFAKQELSLPETIDTVERKLIEQNLDNDQENEMIITLAMHIHQPKKDIILSFCLECS
jgi:hypothetical protein